MDFADAIMARLPTSSVLHKFRLLMGKYWVYALNAIILTRSFHDGLRFVDRLNGVNEALQMSGELSDCEFERYDRQLILFRLQLLDKMDWWKEYLELFQQVRFEKSYSTVHRREYGLDLDFDSYILGVSDMSFKSADCDELPFLEVHFLYPIHGRYKVIQRKWDRFVQGKKTGHLRHRKQSDMTSLQVERVFAFVMDAAERGLDMSYPW